MKPNFALSLSFEGIRLLRRIRGGWEPVGDVSVDVEDLPKNLKALRKKALGKDEVMRSKLILPNEQIKYLVLADPEASEADVRAALDGATPYTVDELVFDHVSYGGRTHVAAVAQETLQEAEDFGVEHGFDPVSFVAEPEPGGFPGEPFFGTTSVATDLIGKRAKVQRDNDPNKMTAPEPDEDELSSGAAPAAPPPEPAAQEPEPEPEPAELAGLDADDRSSDAPEDAPAANEPPAPVAAEPVAPAHKMPPSPGSTDDAVLPLAKNRPMPREVVLQPADADAPQPGHDDADLAPRVDFSPAATVGDPEIGHELVAASTPDPVAARMAPEASDTASMPEERQTSAIDQPTPLSDEMSAPEQPSDAGAQDLQPTVLEDGAHGAATPEDDVEPPKSLPEPMFASRLAGLRVDRRPPPGGAPDIAPIHPPPLSRPDSTSEPAFARSAVLSSRLSPIAPEIGPVAPPASPEGSEKAVDPAQRALPGAGPFAPVDTSARATEKPAVERVEPSDAVKAALMAAVAAPGRDAIGKPPTSLGASLNPVADTAAPPAIAFPAPAAAPDAGGGFFSSRRKRKAADPRVKTALQKPAADKPRTNKGSFPPFGARGSEPRVVGGKPRFLGLILTAILLFFLAGVAAWATFTQSGFAGLFASREAPAEIAPNAPEVSSAETAAVAPPESATPAEPDPTATDAPEVVPDAASDAPDAAAAEATDQIAATPSEAIASEAGDVLSPAAAERFYAATGVWLRAPRLPLMPQSESLGAVPTMAPQALTARTAPFALQPTGSVAPDVTLAPQPVPPSPDARFARDARGFLLATPEGTITPDGMVIYSGLPSVIPPTRPTAEPPPTVAAPPETAPDGDVITAEDALAALALPGSEPPEASSDPTDPVTSEEATAATAGAVDLAGLRPPVRPEDLAPAPQEAAPEQVSFAGPRPNLRPDGLAPEPSAEDTAEPDAVPEDVVEPSEPEQPDVQTTLAAIVASAPDPLANATAQAVARAQRPDARPNNFDRVVAQATARANRAQPAANNGGIAPTALAPSTDNEPEQVSAAAAAPTGPTTTSVASAATIDNAINLRSINLIGVYGRPNDRRALVRLGNGRYVRVGIGDRLDGGQVNAIGDNALNYIKNGRTLTLQIPSG